MIQLYLKAKVGSQLLEWNETERSMKDPETFLGQPDLIKNDMREVFIQTAEPYSTIEGTQRGVKIINSNYTKYEFDKISAEAVQIDKDQPKNVLSLLTEFEELFDRNLGKWDTTPINLEAKPRSKLFNVRYYLVPNSNKETFRKELQRLFDIGMLTPVNKLQYGTPVFVIHNK